MSLFSDVKDQLQQLSHLDWTTTNANTLNVAGVNGTIVAELTKVDAMACEFQSLELHTTRLANASVDALKQLGKKLTERLGYLLEPIHPVECDESSITLQMRSNPPSKDEDGRYYYELSASRHGLHLTRYRKQQGSPRGLVPACVTCEVMSRLATDLDEAVGEC